MSSLYYGRQQIPSLDVHTDGNNILHTPLVKHYNDLLGRQSSERGKDEVSYFYVGDVFCIHLGTKYANFQEKIKLHPSPAQNSVFQASHCSALLIGCVKYCSRLQILPSACTYLLDMRAFQYSKYMPFSKYAIHDAVCMKEPKLAYLYN